MRITLKDVANKETKQDLIKEELSVEVKEGLIKEYIATRYERNPKARRLCLEHYGNNMVCQICGFDFEKTYGTRENAEPYIEIHHITPLAETSDKEGEHNVDYVNDLIPVCANCHRMLHHLKTVTLHPTEMKEIIEQRKIACK